MHFRGSDYAGSRCGGSWCIGSSTAVSDSGRCPSKSAGRCIERSRCLVSRLERYGKTLRGVDRTAAEYDAAESRQCSGRIAELSAGGTPTAAGTDQSGDDGTNLACNFCFAGLPRTDAAKSGQTNRIGIGVDSADTASNGTNTACSDASSSPSTMALLMSTARTPSISWAHRGTAAAVTRNRRIPQNTPIPPCTQAEPANFHYNTFPAFCIPGGKDRPKNAQK